jgi:hypothetical protein
VGFFVFAAEPLAAVRAAATVLVAELVQAIAFVADVQRATFAARAVTEAGFYLLDEGWHLCSPFLDDGSGGGHEQEVVDGSALSALAAGVIVVRLTGWWSAAGHVRAVAVLAAEC